VLRDCTCACAWLGEAEKLDGLIRALALLLPLVLPAPLLWPWEDLTWLGVLERACWSVDGAGRGLGRGGFESKLAIFAALLAFLKRSLTILRPVFLTTAGAAEAGVEPLRTFGVGAAAVGLSRGIGLPEKPFGVESLTIFCDFGDPSRGVEEALCLRLIPADPRLSFKPVGFSALGVGRLEGGGMAACCC
jgi:hypothetical protein